jgi:phospholipid/cholesterol/gamma-HCH transport system permease protein
MYAMDMSLPRIEMHNAQSDGAQGRGVCWAALGSWTAAQMTDREHMRALLASLAASGKADAAWNLRGALQLDHIGAQLLWRHWCGVWPQQLEATPAQRAVLEHVARFTMPAPVHNALSLKQRYLALSDGVLGLLSHGKGFVVLVGQLLIDVLHLVKNPRQGPWRDISGHIYQFGTTALPITALVGFLIGVVLAYLSAQQLKQFGADALIVDLLGVSLVRELGPMLAAILIAGRSGSAITAQIGVMRVTEELDALRVMGIAHGYRLVMPRALALALAMPLISVWTTLAALLGGMLAADVALGITPQFFISALPGAVDLANLVLAVAKTVVFGLLIALVGCHYGLRVKPNTESLGRGTTASVVTSITVVILVDAVFAIAFKDVGV